MMMPVFQHGSVGWLQPTVDSATRPHDEWFKLQNILLPPGRRARNGSVGIKVCFGTPTPFQRACVQCRWERGDLLLVDLASDVTGFKVAQFKWSGPHVVLSCRPNLPHRFTLRVTGVLARVWTTGRIP